MFRLDEYTKLLEALVNTESGSLNAAGITRVADQLEEWFKELGWHCTRHFLDERTGPVLEITNKPGADRYDVTFVGHMDTVFPDGTVAKRPYTMDDVNCYGPGVADMKGGDVAMYLVAKLLDEQVKEKLAICMAFNPDEEIGSIYSRDVLDEIAQKSDYIFVMEGAGGKDGQRHCFARKGMVNYDFCFKGKAGHAGYMFEREMASAVLEMANWVVKLSALASREQNTTVNVGIAQGGTAVNVVAEEAILRMEARFDKYEERDRIKAAVQAMLDGPAAVPGVEVICTGQKQADPWVRTEKAQAYYDHVYRLCEEAGLPFEDKDRGGLSDANHMAQFGAICMDGMGPHGALDHSDKEYSLLASAEYCIKLCSLLLADIAAGK